MSAAASPVQLGAGEGTDPSGGTAQNRSHGGVHAERLVKVYGTGAVAVRALDEVSVSFDAGRLTAIMGPSGSGKSSLLHCLSGLDAASSGEIWLGPHRLSGLSETELAKVRREHVGFVFQSLNLLPALTGRQNVLLPFLLAGRDPDWAWFDTVVEVLGISGRLVHRPAELSGGERQRFALARALVSRPTVVFADEPTASLDRESGAQVLGLLRRCVDELGQTVVMVTHDPVAASYADRVVVLADGRVVGEVRDPSPESVLDAVCRTVG